MGIIMIVTSLMAMMVGMFAAAKVTHTVVNEMNLVLMPMFKKIGTVLTAVGSTSV